MGYLGIVRIAVLAAPDRHSHTRPDAKSRSNMAHLSRRTVIITLVVSMLYSICIASLILVVRPGNSLADSFFQVASVAAMVVPAVAAARLSKISKNNLIISDLIGIVVGSSVAAVMWIPLFSYTIGAPIIGFLWILIFSIIALLVTLLILYVVSRR